MIKNRRLILLIIVFAQFLCTSLWFAGNAVLSDMSRDLKLTDDAVGHIISAVQFGFISGTLIYALTMITDRYSPTSVFLFSSILAALSNLGILIEGQNINSVLSLRFFTGFFLAGIYPVGMKIASDHFEKGLGKALGFLVGALVVGTAFPHLLKSLTASLSWKTVLSLTAALCITGGLLMKFFVPDGPYSKSGHSLNFTAAFELFKNKAFRSAAFGYFGHMWELYTFWAFVPAILISYKNIGADKNLQTSFWAFWIIALGGIACIVSGYISQMAGTKKTAFSALFLSGCCCLLSPLAFNLPLTAFLFFLIFWGLVVIADSPLFSTLVALNAPANIKGTALTLVTCIGFSITIASIELMNYLSRHMNERLIYLFLAPGPLIGLIFMLRPSGKVSHDINSSS